MSKQQMNFWQQISQPIIGLSPMDGVSDHPFRQIQKKYGNPAVVYTEFASVEGICRGAVQLLKDFLYDETQRPIIGQIYGTTPKFFRQTAVLLCELGFDGIDLNMGCPAKNVAHSGAGAALIKTPDLAQKIIRQTKAGVEDWIPRLLELEPACIAIHGRTLRQQYSGLTDWERIGQAAELAKESTTLILGNGDVDSLATAQKRITEYDLAGVLIGRASMGNPYVFCPAKANDPSPFAIAVEHAQLFETTYQSHEWYSFLPMRKHLGWYVRSVPHASDIRVELLQANSSQEVQAVLERHQLL